MKLVSNVSSTRCWELTTVVSTLCIYYLVYNFYTLGKLFNSCQIIILFYVFGRMNRNILTLIKLQRSNTNFSATTLHYICWHYKKERVGQSKMYIIGDQTIKQSIAITHNLSLILTPTNYLAILFATIILLAFWRGQSDS